MPLKKDGVVNRTKTAPLEKTLAASLSNHSLCNGTKFDWVIQQILWLFGWCFQSDNGKEYISNEFVYLTQEGSYM